MPVTFNGEYRYRVKQTKKFEKGDKIFTSFCVTDYNSSQRFSKHKGIHDLNVFHDGDLDILDGDIVVFHKCLQIQQYTTPKGKIVVTINAEFEIVKHAEQDDSSSANGGYW